MLLLARNLYRGLGRGFRRSTAARPLLTSVFAREVVSATTKPAELDLLFVDKGSVFILNYEGGLSEGRVGKEKLAGAKEFIERKPPN